MAYFYTAVHKAFLPVWSDGDDFRNFIFTYLNELPHTNFDDLPDAVFNNLISYTSRTTNDIISVLSQAAYEMHIAPKNVDFAARIKGVAQRDGHLS